MTTAFLIILIGTALIAWAIRTHHSSAAQKWARIRRDVNQGIEARRVR